MYRNVGVPRSNKEAGSFLPMFGPHVEGGNVQVRGVVTRVRSNTCSYVGLKRLLVGRECLCTLLEEKNLSRTNAKLTVEVNHNILH